MQHDWLKKWDMEQQLWDLIAPEDRSIHITGDFATGHDFTVGAVISVNGKLMQIIDIKAHSMTVSDKTIPQPRIGKLDGFRIIYSPANEQQLLLPLPVPPQRHQRPEKPWYRRWL